MPYVPDPEVEREYSFVVTIPSYGKPDRQADHLLETVTRHVQLSISKRATVKALPAPKPRKAAAKKTPATKKPETRAQKKARTTRR